MLNKLYIAEGVCNFFNEASSIKNRLWGIAGNGYRSVKDLLFNKEPISSREQDVKHIEIFKTGFSTEEGFGVSDEAQLDVRVSDRRSILSSLRGVYIDI